TPGMSAGPDGTEAFFAESKADASRLRTVSLTQGAARTIVEQPFAISHPQARPLRAQVLYQQDRDAAWLVNLDGRENRKLKVARGTIGGMQWSRDGKTLLYLNIPEDKTQLNAIREFSPDSNTDK